jgi:predicted RNase H-like nuclease (RuvC/YqgF family)
MFFKSKSAKTEEKLKGELEEAKKENKELKSKLNSICYFLDIRGEELCSARNEITGLRILVDQKTAEIEDLKEQIRGAAS